MNFLKYHFILFFILWSIHLDAQAFRSEAVYLTPTQESELNSQFTNWKSFSIDQNILNNYVKSKLGTFDLTLHFDDLTFDLNLEGKSVMTKNCLITVPTEKGTDIHQIYSVDNYKGKIIGAANSKAQLYISDRQLGGKIRLGNETYQIRPLSALLENVEENGTFVIMKVPTIESSTGQSLVLDDPADCSTAIINNDVETWVEMGVEIDHAYYLKYKGEDCENQICYDNLGNLVDCCKKNAIDKVKGYIANASSVFDDHFYSTLNIVHINIYSDAPDTYGTTEASIFNGLKGTWNAPKPLACIERDVVHFFTAKDGIVPDGAQYGPSGGECGNFNYRPICGCPEGAFSYSNCKTALKAENYRVLLHELGHGFGAGHLDDVCEDGCSVDNAATNPIMCDHGGTVDEYTKFSQNAILARLNGDGCFEEPVELEGDCNQCFATSTLTSDHLNPTPGCSADDIIEYTYEVCNGCKPRTIHSIFFKYNITEHELAIPGDIGDFEYTQQGGNERFLRLDDIAFEANECKQFKVRLKVIDFNINNFVSVSGTANYDDYTYQPFSTNVSLNVGPLDLIEITGTPQNPATISDLIADNDIPSSSGPCINAETQKIKILGVLEIDESYTFAEDSKLIMNPGSEIIIKDGATLILCNSTISGCSQMWKGITVEEGGTLIVTGSTIEDAEFAITANTHSNVEVRTSIFRNNYVGFYVPESVNGIARDVDVGDFYGNVFEGTSALLDAYPGQENYTAWSHAGVLANDVNNLAIEGVGSVSFIYTNNFRNIRNGIMTYNTSLSLNKARFENIDWVSGNQEGVAVYMEGDGDDWFTQSGVDGNSYTEFTSCRNAIRSVGMNLNVYGNNMEEVVRGISVELSSGREVRIHENTIASYSAGINIYQCAPVQGLIYNNEITTIGSFFSMGIFVNENVAVPSGWNITRNLIQISKGGFGIFHRSGRRTSISNNSIYSFESDYNSNSIGIILEGSPEVFVLSNYVEGLGLSKERNYTNKGIFVVNSPSTTVDCNTVDNSDIGIQYWMNCGGNEFSGNTIKNHQIGLLLGNFNGEVPSGDINFDGQFHTGNKWTDLYSGNEIPSGYLGALNLAPIINDVPSFPYPGSLVVDGNENPFFYPTFEAESNNWIQNFSTDLETFSCRYRVGPQGEVEEDKIFHSNILEDGLPKEDTDLQQKNKAMVLQVSQNTIALEHTKFTKEELKILRSIAIQCPIIGGNAVFEARSLLSAIETVHYEDMDLCQSSKDAVEYKSELQYSSFRVFPNPAKDIVTVSFSTPSEKERTLHMLNIFGQYLNDYNIAVGEVSIELDVSNYAPGVYTILLSTDGEKKEVQEVVILE